MAGQTWTPEYAESVVECMEWSLNADADEHAFEVEMERWDSELGETPAMHLALGVAAQLFTARSQWAYRSFPSVRALVDKELM